MKLGDAEYHHKGARQEQNQNEKGLPQLFQYSPEQINLLADMWSYNITNDARETLLGLASG